MNSFSVLHEKCFISFTLLTTQPNIGMSMMRPSRLKPATFDSDSYPILIDNCSTACITNNVNDFIGDTKDIQAMVTVIGGQRSIIKIGTVKWSIEDDQGRTHQFKTEDTFYAHDAPIRLLSPQHWAKSTNDNSKYVKGTWQVT